MLNRTKNTKVRKAILEYADANLISALSECALVDPRLLETLRTPIQPHIDTNLRDLDSEMTSILDKTGIDVSVLCYNDMAKLSATKPTPVVVVKDKGDARVIVYYGRGRNDTSKNATREGTSVSVAFKDNTVERQWRFVARTDGRTRQ